LLRRITADPAESAAQLEGVHMKKTYIRLAVMASSLMALLLAGGANIKRT
jgi:hypothetical protein